MIDNPTLPPDNSTTACNEAIAHALLEIAAAITDIRNRAYPLEGPAPSVYDWPWAPGTVAQGFLNARWNRRDGNTYGSAGLRAVSGPNSPIRGGDDSKSKVDVPSGARRS